MQVSGWFGFGAKGGINVLRIEQVQKPVDVIETAAMAMAMGEAVVSSC
jgi:hypothetical protein